MSSNHLIDRDLLLKNLMGGGAVGVGIGGALALIHHLRELKSMARNQRDTSRDDNVVDITLLGKHASDDSVNAAVNLLAALGGGMGGVLLMRKLQKDMQSREIQESIDRHQKMYFRSRQDELRLGKGGDPEHGTAHDKYAGDKHAVLGDFGYFSTMGGSTLALAALAALGSGALTKKILDKHFPKVKPAQRPMAVNIRREAHAEEPDRDAIEALVRTQMGKRSSELRDLVGAVARGRKAELEHVLEHAGEDAMWDLAKSASSRGRVPGWKNNMAIFVVSHDPVLSVPASIAAARDFADDGPMFVKTAAALSTDYSAHLEGVMSGLGCLHRAAAFEPILRALDLPEEYAPVEDFTIDDERLDKSAAVMAGSMARKKLYDKTGSGWALPALVTVDMATRYMGEDGKGKEEEPSPEIDIEFLLEDDDADIREFVEKFGPDIQAAVRKSFAAKS